MNVISRKEAVGRLPSKESADPLWTASGAGGGKQYRLMWVCRHQLWLWKGEGHHNTTLPCAIKVRSAFSWIRNRVQAVP
jgi:hypothetical protein